LVIYLIDSADKLKKILHFIILIATGLIAFIAIGFIRGNGLWTEFTPLSTAGVRYLAGTHAFYMMLALMLGVSLLIYNRLRSTSLSLVIMLLWSLGITVSLMRHLWLATAIGLVVIFSLVDWPRKKILSTYAGKSALVLISSIVLLVLISNLFYFSGTLEKTTANLQNLTTRIVSLTSLESDTSANWRTNIWYEAKTAWLKNPMYGIGFGHTLLIDQGDWQNFEEIKNIHNSPLAILVQTGLVGTIIFGLIFLTIGLKTKDKLFKNEDLKPYCFGLVATLVIFLFCSLFQPYLETNLTGIWLWLILGLIRAASLITIETKPQNK
jgi:O-antigen ligase